MLMHKYKKNSGFTLLEIVVATTLLAITLMGLGALFVTAQQLSKHSVLTLSAMEQSKFYLNALYRDVRQDRIQNGAADNCFVSSPGGCENTVYVDPNYNKTITPDFTVTPAFATTYKVRLQLDWDAN